MWVDFIDSPQDGTIQFVPKGAANQKTLLCYKKNAPDVNIFQSKPEHVENAFGSTGAAQERRQALSETTNMSF